MARYPYKTVRVYIGDVDVSFGDPVFFRQPRSIAGYMLRQQAQEMAASVLARLQEVKGGVIDGITPVCEGEILPFFEPCIEDTLIVVQYKNPKHKGPHVYAVDLLGAPAWWTAPGVAARIFNAICQHAE
jgi:hypothetical protein